METLKRNYCDIIICREGRRLKINIVSWIYQNIQRFYLNPVAFVMKYSYVLPLLPEVLESIREVGGTESVTPISL